MGFERDIAVQEPLRLHRYVAQQWRRCAPVLFFVLASRAFVAAHDTATAPFTLDELVGEALRENPEMRALSASIDSARGEVTTAATWPNPELSLSPKVAHVKGDGSRGTTEFDGQYGFTQTIEFPGKRALRRALAERNVDIRELALGGFRNQLRVQVTNVYYRLLASAALVSLKEKRLALARTFVAAARRKVDAGFAPEFEATKAEVEVVAGEKALREAQAEHLAARAVLNTLLGRKPGDALTIAGTIDAGAAAPDESVLLAEAQARNPILKVQAAEVERTRVALALARRSRLPDFTVGPSYETEPDTSFYAFGISLPLPLWDQKKGEIATAEAEERRASAELIKLQLEIARDVLTSAQQLAAAREGLSYYTPELRAKLANALDAAASTYAEGRTTLLVFLETQRTYFDTQTDYFQTLEKLYDARAALESALGGPLTEIQTPTPDGGKGIQ